MSVSPTAHPRPSVRVRLTLLAGLIVLGGVAPPATAAPGPATAGDQPSAVSGQPATEQPATERQATERAVKVPRARAARATVSGPRVVLRWTRPRGARVTVIETKDRTAGQKAWRRPGKPVRGTKKTLTGLRAGHAYRIRLIHRSAARGGRAGRPGPSILVRVPRAPAPAAPGPGERPGFGTYWPQNPPPQVTGLRVVAHGDAGVTLSWNLVMQASTYRVERIDVATGTVERLPGDSLALTRDDTPPPHLAGRWLQYRVVARNGPVDAVPSDPVEARAPGFPAYARYYALGDSYAAGTGIGQPYDDQQCSRSNAMWAALIDRAIVPQPQLIACSGAVTQDVRLTATDGIPQYPDLGGTQLDLVQRDLATHSGPSLITISVGGNDARFVPQFTQCVLVDCTGDAETETALIRGEVRQRLDATFAQIRAVAPAADVLIVGYPRLFTEAAVSLDPSLLTVTQSERVLANLWADQLNEEVAASARAHGLHPVTTEVVNGFLGHGAGSADPWINGVVLVDPATPPGVPAATPATKSIHPNPAGNAGYAVAVEGALREYASKVRLRGE